MMKKFVYHRKVEMTKPEVILARKSEIKDPKDLIVANFHPYLNPTKYAESENDCKSCIST